MPQPSVLVTFIRHGESTDNLRSVWAGWQDAPLSNHGMNQALAVGKFFADTRFDAIYASTLKRAYSTAQAVYDGQTDPKPPFTSSPLLREQHFGQGEGHKWTYQREESLTLEEHYARGIYPVLFEDDEKFPGGESPNDLDIRANQAIEELGTSGNWHQLTLGKWEVGSGSGKWEMQLPLPKFPNSHFPNPRNVGVWEFGKAYILSHLASFPPFPPSVNPPVPCYLHPPRLACCTLQLDIRTS